MSSKIRSSQVIAFVLTMVIVVSGVSYALGIVRLEGAVTAVREWTASLGSDDEDATSSPTASSGTPPARAKVIDKYKGVSVYYNGRVGNVSGRNVAADGYNLGLRYQCVEFVKRFYYEHYGHKMPDSYGHAKDFFDASVSDGEWNRARALTQYTNPSTSRPKEGDLLVYGPTAYNKFGHVAIVSKVERSRIEIIQQNPGIGNPSREWLPLTVSNGRYSVQHEYVRGWLRK